MCTQDRAYGKSSGTLLLLFFFSLLFFSCVRANGPFRRVNIHGCKSIPKAAMVVAGCALTKVLVLCSGHFAVNRKSAGFTRLSHRNQGGLVPIAHAEHIIMALIGFLCAPLRTFFLWIRISQVPCFFRVVIYVSLSAPNLATTTKIQWRKKKKQEHKNKAKKKHCIMFLFYPIPLTIKGARCGAVWCGPKQRVRERE